MMRFLSSTILLFFAVACKPGDPIGDQVTCKPGEVLTGGACTACTLGTFSTSGTASACEPMTCAPGEIATLSGAVTATDGCVPCSPGAFSEGGATLECIRCLDGTFDDDDDPATACTVCTPCADGSYTAQKCSGTSDTACAACAEPEAGEYSAAICASGSLTQTGRNTEIGTCAAPGDHEYVVSTCVAGTSKEIGSDTELGNCSVAGEQEYVSVICAAGDFENLGSDSEALACTSVEAGQYAAEACRQGTVRTLGSDTVVAQCSAPGAAAFVTALCEPGSADRAGRDTQTAPCGEPEAGNWVTATCRAGALDTLGSDTVTAGCRAPGEGQYVGAICIAGSSAELGHDIVAMDCAAPEEGHYTIAVCVAGDWGTAGANTATEACGEADAGEYLISACVAGSAVQRGRDTEIMPCTAIDHCAAGLSCTNAEDSICEACDDGYRLTNEGHNCAADPPSLPRTLLFSSIEGFDSGSSRRGVGDACGAQVVIGDQDVVISGISAAIDLDRSGNIRFVIFEHDNDERRVFLSEPKAFIDDGRSWKRSDHLDFTLQAGRTYDISGIADVSARYHYDTEEAEANGIRSTRLNPNLLSYQAPRVDDHGAADCGIQLLGPPSGPPPPDSLLLQSIQTLENWVPRSAGQGCGTKITVGDTDVDVNWIGSSINLDQDGLIKFLIFDHSDDDQLVYESQPKAFTQDSWSWKVSAPFVFTLEAGGVYDIVGSSNVSARYAYDTEIENSGGLTTTSQNPNVDNFETPFIDDHAGADCGIQVFTAP